MRKATVPPVMEPTRLPDPTTDLHLFSAGSVHNVRTAGKTTNNLHI